MAILALPLWCLPLEFVVSCEGCLLGHVVIPNLVFPQPILPSLWWLLHSFLNGVIQSGDAWNWDIEGAALYQLLGSLVPVGPSSGRWTYHFWFCNPPTCLWTVKQCSTHSTLVLPMVKRGPLVSIYALCSTTGTTYFTKY